MRGLTDEERAALEQRGSLDFWTGHALLRRGLLVLTATPEGGNPDHNHFATTEEGRRALRFDAYARAGLGS
jgi:hypothetical protein